MLLEAFYHSKQKILKESQKFFFNSNSLIPKIGCELEFFLLESSGRSYADTELVNDFIAELKKNFQTEKERGVSQIEIKTRFRADLSGLCEEIENCKKLVTDLACKRKLSASFAAQPFTEDCGNALQFNISLHDKNGRNLFVINEKLLKDSATKLLQLTNEMMIFMAPRQEDYIRFSFDLNHKLFCQGKFTAPVNLSFGSDNRTCAIRIPSTKNNKRLEYRIASATADPWLCISAILLALAYCPAEPSDSVRQIFGNAFDEQYKLQNFCLSLDEAEKKFFTEKNFIRKKFEEFLL